MNSGATVVPGQLLLDPGAEALDALARDLGPDRQRHGMRSGNAGEPAIRCIDAPSRSTRKTAAEVTPGRRWASAMICSPTWKGGTLLSTSVTESGVGALWASSPGGRR